MTDGNNDYQRFTQMLSRREMFSRVGSGLTGIALASLLADDAEAESSVPKNKPFQGAHFPPKQPRLFSCFNMVVRVM